MKIGPTKGKKKRQKSKSATKRVQIIQRVKYKERAQKGTMGKTHGMVRGPRQRGAHALIHKEGKVNNDPVKLNRAGETITVE